ncbi:MAG: protein kinase [Planctomycetota bacterium]|jgi:serine/threonine protein kinase|nr:protein kinase [Planctomycetota bacterium]
MSTLRRGTTLAVVDPNGRSTIDVQRVLGTGGQGSVYKAQRRTGVDTPAEGIALKVFTDTTDWDVDPHFITQHRDAIRNAAIPEAPVQAHELTDTGAVNYTVSTMPLVPGGPLTNQLVGGHKATSSEAANLLGQMAVTLHDMDRRGVVHRDIKPANIISTPAVPSPEVRHTLIDWDLAVPTKFDGNTCGTFDYIAPELLLGRKPEPTSDVYSLAATTATMMTNASPNRCDLKERVAWARQADPQPVLKDVGDPYLKLVLDRASHAHPEKRSTPTDLMVDLLPLPAATRTWQPEDFSACADRLIVRRVGHAERNPMIEAFAAEALLRHLPEDHGDRDIIALMSQEGAPFRKAWTQRNGPPVRDSAPTQAPSVSIGDVDMNTESIPMTPFVAPAPKRG